MSVSHTSLQSVHAPTAGFAMCLASLFATNANTGLAAATNASLIADDRNDVA